MTPLLKTEGLTVTFGGLNANDGVDLIVEAGSFVGLIGPNGAGKTTFIDVYDLKAYGCLLNCRPKTRPPTGIWRVHTAFKIEPEIGNNLQPMRFKYFLQREERGIKTTLLDMNSSRPSRRVSRFHADRNLSPDTRPVILATP